MKPDPTRFFLGFFWLLWLLWTGIAVPDATGHDLGVARVSLTEIEAGTFVVEAKLPRVFDPADPVFPPRFTSEPPRFQERGTDRIHRYEYRSDRTLSPEDIVVLPWIREGVFLAATWNDGTSTHQFFPSNDESIVLPVQLLRSTERNLTETISHYVELGIEHILMGWDHLAFVLCLCLLVSGWKLVKLITAFTLGHSITLAASVLGIARVSIGWVEAGIALSIVLLARQILTGRGLRHGAGIAAGFGLLHGLGFASALREAGIASAERIPGLVAFNVGVEIGQILFVAGILALTTLARRIDGRAVRGRAALAYGLGAIALFWTVERIHSAATEGPGAAETIVVDQDVLAAATENREFVLGRNLTEFERDQFRQEWIDAEVLLREAHTQGLVEDEIIRRRLVDQLLLSFEEQPPEPTDSQLHEFFVSNPGLYISPEAVSFEHLFRSSRPGPEERIVERLTAGDDPQQLGDPFGFGSRFNEVSLAELHSSLGPDFAERFSMIPGGIWTGPHRSLRGYHFVRILDRIEARPLSPEEIERRLPLDWKNHWSIGRRDREIADLRERYRVESDFEYREAGDVGM